MAATLNDVAEESKVSISTVSCVINGKDFPTRYSEETKQKVLEAAERLGYIPNRLARGLNLKRTGTIGVVFTNALGTFMNEIINGIQGVTHKQGFDLFLCISDDDWQKEASHIRMLRERKVDGMIVFMVACSKKDKISHEHILSVKDAGIPLVFVDRYLPGVDIDYVVADDFHGAYDAVNHLIKLGHRKIAHVTTDVDCTSNHNRLAGYTKALSDAGIPINNEYIKTTKYFGKEAGHEPTLELLAMKERPTAIFFISDGVAIDALEVIKRDGFMVPEDIAIVSFGNSRESAYLEVPLTAVDQPPTELGKRAGEIIIDKIENPDEKGCKQVSIKPTLVVRESCGASLKSR